jgi:hypothetical protein
VIKQRAAKIYSNAQLHVRGMSSGLILAGQVAPWPTCVSTARPQPAAAYWHTSAPGLATLVGQPEIDIGMT